MSGRLKIALNSVPHTNPICTARVSQFALASLNCHSVRSDGTTAEPLNHRDMPSSSARASRIKACQRDADESESGSAGSEDELTVASGNYLACGGNPEASGHTALDSFFPDLKFEI